MCRRHGRREAINSVRYRGKPECLSIDETVVSVSTRALVTGGLHRLGEAVRRALAVAVAAVAETAVAETAVTVAESTQTETAISQTGQSGSIAQSIATDSSVAQTAEAGVAETTVGSQMDGGGVLILGLLFLHRLSGDADDQGNDGENLHTIKI